MLKAEEAYEIAMKTQDEVENKNWEYIKEQINVAINSNPPKFVISVPTSYVSVKQEQTLKDLGYKVVYRSGQHGEGSYEISWLVK